MAAILDFIKRMNKAIRPFMDQLDRLSALEPDWDGNGAEAPAAEATDNARAFLSRLGPKGFFPTGILPSAEGGIGIFFRNGNRYADIEFFNTGEIFGVTLDGSGKVQSFKLDRSFEAMIIAVRGIHDFVVA
jgi:hypothetical protein